jgi:hypothetical protein
MSDVHDRISDLEQQLAALKAQVGPPNAATRAAAADEAVNRRSLLKKTGVAIAGVAAGGAVLAHASPAGALDTDPLILGVLNTETSPTELRVVNGPPRVMLLVNQNTGFSASSSAVPAALGGWGSGDHYGIYAWGAAKPGLVAGSGSSDVAAIQLFTTGAPPTAGAHTVGELVALANGALVVCSESGTPGTWSNVGFNAVTPTRYLDTRNGVGLSGPQGAGDDNVRTLDIGGTTIGTTTIPASARAVAANITVTNPTSGGYITLWNTGVPRPDSSNVNFLPDQTVANFGLLKLGTAGAISIFNAFGDADILIDVAGYFI